MQLSRQCALWAVRRRGWVIFWLCLAGLDMTGTVAYSQYAQSIRPPTVPAAGLPGSSVFVVFFHGPSNDQTGLDERTRHRIDYARARPCLAGCDYLFLGGHWASNRHVPNAMLRYARASGFGGDSLLADTWSHDTITNIQALVQHQQVKQWERLRLCSSPLHLVRIRYLVEQQLAVNPGLSAALESENCESGLELPLWDRWREVHHEWSAFLLYWLLPRQTVRHLMRWLRL
ncbi:MAG: YdcF family protein [Leptospiraceae bacterium]|nr:YdcF family protein [Leptospiraceae bacterium]